MHFDLFDVIQVPFKIIRGPLVDEVHQEFSSWIYQVSKTYIFLVAIYLWISWHDIMSVAWLCLEEVNVKLISWGMVNGNVIQTSN